MPRLHALGVEVVAVFQAHRERVVPEPAVEPGVDPPERAVREPVRSGEVLAVCHIDPRPPARPPRRFHPRNEKDRGELSFEALVETAHDPRVDEDADREKIGEDDPRALHRATTPTLSAI